ncbi:MAG: hypothetical protein LUE08_00075 [Akkermansiaceae bacterium]|nr:hypothetical protein [Akkermansiaceae bacterium]
MFDMDKETARSVLKQLKDLGYGIDVLEMGTQRKIKVNIQQFRAALLMEFRQHSQRRAAV